MAILLGRAARVSLLACVCALVFAAAGVAQETPRVVPGRLMIRNPVGDHFGAAVAAAGDVNGDGVPDLIVGAPQPQPDQPGYAAIHSGSDGALIRRLEGRATADFCGFAVAGGEDVDGDGTPDQAVAALNWCRSPDGGESYVTVRSGADGSAVHELEAPPGSELYGHAVLLLGDCNGDGKSELVVAAPSADTSTESGPGRVYIHDGATGAVKHVITGPHRKSLFALCLAAAGDLDGDGAPDFLIGAPGDGPLGQGSVLAISGRTGAALFELAGEGRDEGLGVAVSARLDFDGDGRRDLVVSAYGLAYTTPGSVRVISSATRATLVELPEEPEGFHPGRVQAVAADLDGDGAIELLCADPFAHGSALRVYDQDGGSEEVSAVPSHPEGGIRLSVLGDLDADGADDFAVSCAWSRSGSDPKTVGSATVYSGRTRAPLFTLWGS